MRRFCTDITKVESYDLAKADNFEGWHCHHRLETHKYKDRSRKEWIRRDENVPQSMLVVFGVYFNRPPEELVYLRVAEHTSLHHKGRVRSEAERLNVSKGHLGHTPWNKGKKGCYSEEHLQRLREAHKGKKLSEEHKRKVSEALKGKTRPDWVRKKLSEAAKLREAAKREARRKLTNKKGDDNK